MLRMHSAKSNAMEVVKAETCTCSGDYAGDDDGEQQQRRQTRNVVFL